METGPGLVNVIDAGVASYRGGFERIVRHYVRVAFALPNGLADPIHGVVPVRQIALDVIRPAKLYFLDLSTKPPEDVEGGERVGSHFRLDFDVAQVDRPGDLHAPDVLGAHRQFDPFTERIVIERMRALGHV